MKAIATALLCVLWADAASAAFGPGAVRDKQEIIAKLSNDINKVDHSINVTKDLIKKSPDSPYLADLYLRLAELYVERSRYVYRRVLELQPEDDRMLGEEKSLEVKISKRLAIETYEKILQEFPDYVNNDQVRFFRAHEFRELGEWETMLEHYRDLIAKHPKSNWAIEARLILADYHFDKGEMSPAERFYGDILKLPESHLHDMARYKMGWIRINQDRHNDALKLFEAAVKSEHKSRRGAIGDARSLDVKREALLALTWPYTETRKAADAPRYLRSLAEAKGLYVAALKRLANRYFIKSQYVNAAFLYREIVEYQADLDENVEFLQRIYDSVRNMSARNPRRYAQAERDVAAIVDAVARFRNNQKFSDEEKGRLSADFEIRARDLATQLQLEAQNKKDQQRAARAADAYKSYLSVFDDSKERRNLQENRAQALYQAKQFVDAGLQYEQIAKEDDDKGQQRAMLYSAIQAWHEALEADTRYREKNPSQGGILNRLELLRAREGLKQVGGYYVQNWPQDQHIPSVKFNVAKMYYQNGEYEKSAELFAAFIDEYPTHKDMVIAGNLALDALSKLDQLDAMAKLADTFVSNPKIADRAFKNEAATLAKAARQRKIELTVIASADGEFGDRMLTEWEKHKDSQEGEEFLYAAFVKFKSEYNAGGVFDFGGRLLGAYPDSQRSKEVLATMGSFAVRVVDFERAAFLFEEYYKRFSKEPEARGMLLNAANIRFMLGQTDKAAESFRLARTGGDAAQQTEAHERLMTIYRDAEDWPALGRVAQTAVKWNANWLGAVAHLGLAYARTDRAQLAARELERAAGLAAKSGFDEQARAMAYLELGQLLQAQFDAIRFADADSAEAVLAQKIQYLEAIEQMYVGAIGSGQGDWAIAALHSAARLYRDFGAFIERAPAPGNLSVADRKAYAAALKQQAQSYGQKGQETLNVCSQKAVELKVFTGYASACVAGGFESVVADTRRVRTSRKADDNDLRELGEVRVKLAKTPENSELLIAFARLSIQSGDFHQGKLVLLKLLENKSGDAVAQNLLGVAHWSLGEVAQAHALFEAARSKTQDAVLNLAALLAEYGYKEQSQRWLRGADVGGDLSRADLHPAVQKLLGSTDDGAS